MASMSQLRNEVVARVAPALPRKLREKLVPQVYSWSYADLKIIATAQGQAAKTRLLIAPANYASQAHYWARAAETLPGVFAQNLAYGHSPSTIVLKPDVVAHANAGKYSKLWAQKQRKAILRDFTHVLYEAERPILGGFYGGDVIAEISDLQKHGIKVAMLSHGSDVRTPSRHVEIERFSPFVEPLNGLTESLEIRTAQNHRVLEAFDVPKYVSTPDLLDYLPEATWLPTLTDAARWEQLAATSLGQRTPVVLHVPSRSALKGTVSIRSAMRRLEAEGLIEYLEAEGVPYNDMPGMIERADIVIDQVSMGLYGIASIEAMLAGRLVVAQAGDRIREHIQRETGRELPIIEANPDTLYDVVKDVAQSPTEYEERVGYGREFARDVHSPERVAKKLAPFLLS